MVVNNPHEFNLDKIKIDHPNITFLCSRKGNYPDDIVRRFEIHYNWELEVRNIPVKYYKQINYIFEKRKLIPIPIRFKEIDVNLIGIIHNINYNKEGLELTII